jgi:Na+/H+-dicarboxylate symporter
MPQPDTAAPRERFPLHLQILAAMLLGSLLAWIWGDAAATALGWLGTLFIRLLKMTIVPLVTTSIISGVASVGSGGAIGRLGIKTLLYYFATSLAAILVGLLLVNLLQPGSGAFAGLAAGAAPPTVETPASLADILFRMIPTNPIAALASMDMLGIIFFALAFGAALATAPESTRAPLTRLIDAAFAVMMRLTAAVIRLAPLGVLGLITTAVAASGAAAFSSMARYMLTIACGLAIHTFITLPLLLRFVGGLSPSLHFRHMRDALLTAISTSSSAATLPVTLRCVEERAGVSNHVSAFVLPLGATVNMDGTALYECVGVLFIAQVLGVPLDLSAQITVVLTALLASVGAAGIPSAGLVMIFIVLEAVHLEGPEVAAIVGTMLAVDRPLDMLRTGVNIFSDSCGAAIIARSEGEHLNSQLST